MEAARRAGGTEAATASNRIPNAAAVSTSGSNGLTSNSNERSSVEAAAAPARPRRQPIAASFTPDSSTRRTMPARSAPSAMRIAISCTREATEKAMTLEKPSKARRQEEKEQAELVGHIT